MKSSSRVTLSEHAEKRLPPRAEADMQENYLERFDFDTLISDAFETNEGIEITMPPPLNLEPSFRQFEYAVDGKIIPPDLIEITIADRGAYITLRNASGRHLTLDGPLGRYEVRVQSNALSRFRGRRVVVTHQKDNNLEWIAYWAHHHSHLYGFDSVLIYDNSSESYAASDVEKVLHQVPGVTNYEVVEWPTPFGLTGGPNGKWDSDFGQHVFLRDSYSRFLREAELVLVCDIDELLVLADRSITPLMLANSHPDPVTYFRRRQVVQVLAPGKYENELRTHASYGYSSRDGSFLANKYMYVPGRVEAHTNAWLKVHTPQGLTATTIDPAAGHIRHFGGIRIMWRDSWAKRVANASSWPVELEIDQEFLRDSKESAESWTSTERKISALGVNVTPHASRTA